jgi:penicillin-binding protein 1C
VKKRYSKYLKRQWLITKGFLILCLVLVLVSRFLIPNPVFEKPTSTVLIDKDNRLLGARIAHDGQWRFPESDQVSTKFESCILTFEDQYFRKHLGVNPVALARALKVNIQAGKVKQGGSTITMQVARIWQDGKPRTILQKIKELFIALHFEINYSKDEILNLYCSHAPFGGNVVGIETASWRYFGRGSENLTWSESAVLAVLPNAPSLIYPGRNEILLREKRDRLLDKLSKLEIITPQENQLAKLEPLPGRAKRLPNLASHLMDRAAGDKNGKLVETDIDYYLQERVQQIVNRFSNQYQHNEIYNASAVIIETKTGNVISYVGNTTNSKEHGNAVDIIHSERSTGSLLKPFLYAASLSKGEILPKKLLSDIPTFISGYAPENYHKSFDGVVPANEALYRSLNVPFVRLLREYGVGQFYSQLKLMNMKTLHRGSANYGLSLILGGAEGQLMELASMYAGMGRVLASYDGGDWAAKENFFNSHWLKDRNGPINSDDPYLTPAAIYETLNALTEAKRPLGEQGWKSFSSSKKIGWKTGTSFGNRDAWAIGTTPEYTIGVWVGNADGEGRSGLTGLGFAAPILFELFEEMPPTSWFEKPFDNYKELLICAETGMLANQLCVNTAKELVPSCHYTNAICENHQLIHLDNTGKHQVNSACESPENMVHTSWFILSPSEEWYFKRKSFSYKSLPPFREDCALLEDYPMEFIYPKNPNRIYLPVGLDGEKGKAVFELAHRRVELKVFWYLDGEYIGITKDFHQMEINTGKGKHSLLVTDENGNELWKIFEVLSK